MFQEHFQLSSSTLPIIEEIGEHMPGGFFIYRAQGEGELLYVNRAAVRIFGCETLEDFKELTGFTFRGLVHPGDYDAVLQAIHEQVSETEDHLDYVEFRIVRKDGAVRWVDDYGHYTETEAYGGIHYVFISDITEKRERMASDLATRSAVIEALSESYHTVWLIKDVEKETFSLYRGDTEGDSVHASPIRDALSQMKYSQAKEYYIKTTVAPEDRERLQAELALPEIARKLRDKPQYSVNYLRLMPDGSQHYFRIEFARVSMPDGKMGVVCGFKDVDEDVREAREVQKALQEAKRAEEENRRLIQEAKQASKITELTASVASLLTNMPAMTFSKDAETGVYVACNQSFADYAHAGTPEGVVGRTDHQIFDPVTAQHFVEDDQKALNMDGPYVFIEDVPDAKGNPRHLQTTKLRFFDASGRLCVLGMCVDVTEMARLTTQETEGRVRAQEAQKHQVLREQLEEQEKEAAQQLKMITALAADYRSVYYIELDRDAAVCYQAHTGLENSYQVGDQFPYLAAFTSYAQSYIPDPFREEFIRFIQPDAIRERLKNERVISYRYIVKHGAQEAYEMIRFAGVRHPEDRDDHLVHNVSACFSDVDSETRHTLAQSQALSDALRAAEDASKAKTVFLSNMSHEIRTPMNAIIGLNNIALNDPATPAHTREYLLKMNTSAHHLLNIINDILDMSRIESGRMTIRSEEFSFAGMLEQVNTIINGQCRDKGLNYECRLVGDIHDYYIGDDMKLRQVLINILGNSVKFTPEGGSVTFLVEETAHYDGKTTLRFVMRDTGIGMSPEFLPRIFDTFSQEETRVANRYGSTGLGMPITKSIVELMNGTIGVESEKGKGTTFTVTLTFKDAHHAGLADQEGDLKPNEMSVLVIDDDVVAREHAKIVLGQVGIGCELAASGEEGLEMVRMRHARRDPYHLILIDWKMPEMDGVETTRHIRAVVGDGTPIIILTSYNWEDIAEEARKAGVDTFVPKPLFAASVMDEFRTAFRRKNIATTRRQVDLAGKRILLAEDVPVNAEIMMMVLSMRQMEVDLAENGRIAIELFASHPEHTYAAILMDMRMPEMDGLEATTAIRAMDRADAQTIPIIALTANAFDEDVQRSMQAGLNAHLSKPVEPKTLYATLEGLIEEDK